MTPNALDLGGLLQGEFTLEEKLGGQVYRARRRRDGRDLAVRIVRPPTPLLAAEFIALAEAASRVRHPALATVEEFGRMGDQACYIASEFVHGQKLDEWADTVGIPPLAQVIELIRRLCIGLQAAARAGVAHDGLNPRNLRVLGSSKGSGTRTPVKLLDLGVPALLFEQTRDPKAVRFMAPEQLQVLMRPEQPETFRCSETMNVYSCGSLLYYLATGGPPHPGSAPSELLASQAAGRLAPPIRINPQISPGLNAVVLRALAIEPSERFASVAELGEALANVSISVPLHASRMSNPPSVRSSAAPPVPARPSAELLDDPPTFKTSRIAELEAAARAERDLSAAQAERALAAAQAGTTRPPSGSLAEDDKPTVPPPAASTASPQPVVVLDARDSISGVAPIGLFSSAPPEDERLSSRPPAPANNQRSAPPLAAFSQPPPAADGGRWSSAPLEPLAREGALLTTGEFVRGEAAVPPLTAAEPAPMLLAEGAKQAAWEARTASDAQRPSDHGRRRTQHRSVLMVALPLAAATCLGAFFAVRGLLAPELGELAEPAADGGRVIVTAEPPPSAEPAPLPGAAPAQPEPPPAPPAQPELPSAINELIPDGALNAAPRGREWKDWRDNHDYRDTRERGHRSSRSNRGGNDREGSDAKDAKEAKADSNKAEEPAFIVHSPPPDPAEVEPEPVAARAKAPEPEPAAPAPPRTNGNGAPAVAPRTTPSPAVTSLPLPARPAPAPELPLQARAQIGAVTVRGSLPTSLVRRAVERIRSQFETCYTRAAQGAGHNGFGELIVDVQIDERGRARDPHVRGGTLPRLDACVAEAASKLISEKAPDTGTVTASWKVAFSP